MLIRELRPSIGGGYSSVLLEIQHSAYRIEASLINDDRIPPLHEDIAGLCGAPLTWLAAFIGGRLVGAVAWLEVGDQFEIDRLMVAPTVHRRGIGKALVSEVLRRAGAKETIVSTGSENAPARSLYEGLGFAGVGEREPVPGL